MHVVRRRLCIRGFNMVRGIFISFEGPEGAGKSTQIQKVKDYLNKNRIPCRVVREPGGTQVGNAIRSILLNPEFKEMVAETEMLLYAASRSQLVRKVILPALEQGEVVLCDRYVDSSIAYQGYGAEKSLDMVHSINRLATGGLLPDRTYLLDLPVEEGEKRILARGGEKDRMEQKEKWFHERVRAGYRSMAQAEPNRFKVIDASGRPEEVFEQILPDLLDILKVGKKGVLP